MEEKQRIKQKVINKNIEITIIKSKINSKPKTQTRRGKQEIDHCKNQTVKRSWLKIKTGNISKIGSKKTSFSCEQINKGKNSWKRRTYYEIENGKSNK